MLQASFVQAVCIRRTLYGIAVDIRTASGTQPFYLERDAINRNLAVFPAMGYNTDQNRKERDSTVAHTDLRQAEPVKTLQGD